MWSSKGRVMKQLLYADISSSVCLHLIFQHMAFQHTFKPMRDIPHTCCFPIIPFTIRCTIALHCNTHHCTALYYTVCHCTIMYCTAIHLTALHCTTLLISQYDRGGDDQATSSQAAQPC